MINMVKVKICGITSLEDALTAIECGTDMLGFIFAPSPRRMESKAVREIIASLPSEVKTVGVFMDNRIDEVNEALEFCHLDMAQLHGEESPDFCAGISRPVIKVFTPANLPPLERLRDYPVEALMLDKQKWTETEPEELWPIAREMTSYGKVILAGGLTPENVAAAIRMANPYAVDVASGIETEMGRKDHQRIKDFIRAAGTGGAN